MVLKQFCHENPQGQLIIAIQRKKVVYMSKNEGGHARIR